MYYLFCIGMLKVAFDDHSNNQNSLEREQYEKYTKPWFARQQVN